VQLLHGICYAFFFATVYIFVDEAFPKDVRSSAQGLFNLLILGIGNMVASYFFPNLVAKLTGPMAWWITARCSCSCRSCHAGRAGTGLCFSPAHGRTGRSFGGRLMTINMNRRGLLAAMGARPCRRRTRLGAPRTPLFKRINKPLGVQLYALGEAAQKDMAGTLKRLAAIGYTDFELPGLYGRSPRICAPTPMRRALWLHPHGHAPALPPAR
jgi:MFS family permease